MDRQAHWQQVYSAKRDTEVSWFQDHPDMSLAMIADARPDLDTPILDVGGGASRLVDHLLNLGYRDLTILDISEAALAAARSRLGASADKPRWVAADVTRWQPAGPFGVWHDRAAFHFLTEAEDRKAYARTMATAVAPGGQAIIATFAADGPERCSDLPVRRYDAAALEAEFAPDFRLADARAHEHRTPAGKVQKFQFCRLIRA